MLFKDELDYLLNRYQEFMPREVYLVKNPERFPIIEKAVSEIVAIALDCDESAKIEIRPDELTGSILCLKIITDTFVVDMIDKFCEALKEATTFEACPLTDGNVSIAMIFDDAWMPAPAHKN